MAKGKKSSTDHLFKPGQKAGPGRPKGSSSGRTKALGILDDMWAKEEVQAMFRKKLLEACLKDPIDVFRTLVMPLLPSQAKVNLDTDGVITLRFEPIPPPSEMENESASLNTSLTLGSGASTSQPPNSE